jgi:hypothetical protein
MESLTTSSLVPALWLITGVTTLIALGFGLVLTYHWIRFSSSTAATIFTLITYGIGAFVFLIAMLAVVTTLSL